MFLSMIIPIYNAGKYLAECLDSCTQQNISPDDYEIICVNDGSTDDSPAILNAYASRFRQIKVITQSNAGVSAARNAGMDNAAGDYIWFIDADDIIVPNCLKHLRETCAETDCDRLGFSLISVPEDMPSWEKRQEADCRQLRRKANLRLGIHRPVPHAPVIYFGSPDTFSSRDLLWGGHGIQL